MDLDRELPLGLASRYSNPKDGTQRLPRIYGDFLSSTAIPSDDADGGFLPMRCIDRFNQVWLLNDGRVPSSPRPLIYANDVRQVDTPTIYTWTPAVDYESVGRTVSIVQFNVNTGSFEFSWRGHGTANSAGTLITNPIDAISDAFSAIGGWSSADIDQPSVAQTRADMVTLGDTIHWCFDEQQSYRALLQEILRHYHTDTWEQEDGRLRLMLDRSVTTLPVTVLDIIDAETDLVGTARRVGYRQSASNLVNTVRVSRRQKWSTRTYTDVPTLINQASVNLYGTCYRAFELPGCYSDAELQRWYKGLIAKHGLKPAIVRFTVRGLSLIGALPGVFLGFLWPQQGWTSPRLLKVLEQVDVNEGQDLQFVCFDCQRFVGTSAVLASDPFVAARRRIAEGTLAVDTTAPAAASNLTTLGAYRSIILTWTPPGDLDYDHTEIWSASVNNRASAVPIYNGGYQVIRDAAGQVKPVKETISVGEAATQYFWLMTVDATGNGRGGTGNWFPSSATAGVVGTAVLVPTPGIAPAAVTSVYGTGYAVSPNTVTSGQFIASGSFVPSTEPFGSLLIWATCGISIPPLCTLIAQIRESSVAGPILGQTHVANIFNNQTSFYVNVPGAHFNPTFGVSYFLVVDVRNQAFGTVIYTIEFAAMIIQHTKK